MTEMKYCKNPECKNINPQPIDCFYRNKTYLENVCNDCRRKRDRKYYSENKESRKLYQKQYRLKHPDIIKKNIKSWKMRNPERRKELDKCYRDRNKDKINEKHRRWYHENPQLKKNYYTENRDHITEYGKRLYHNKKRLLKCEKCGKYVLVPKYHALHGQRFCSYSCANSGENNVNWQGGISFEPYCPKWNDNLRKRIRDFFDNECIMCGKSREENGQNLSCHHVEYNKQACCDGKPVHFAALCKTCHNKTNKDRERWEAMLHRIIDEIYDGRSYYTKEEIY